MTRARALIEEMKVIAPLDVITYNTLLKGYCAQGDLQGARRLLVEIEAAGLKPNDVSYNSVLNTAVSCGKLDAAWDTIAQMERDGVPVDHYTVSIMMKALKK